MPLSHQHSPMDVERLDLGRDRDQDQVLAPEYATAALQYYNYRLCTYLESFITPELRKPSF